MSETLPATAPEDTPKGTPRPLVAVSLKMYLSAAATRSYVARVAQLARALDPRVRASVEIAVLPTFPLLESAAAALAPAGVSLGAQDVAPSHEGAQTGEVGADVLVELGCRYVEIGHAERRALFGEDARMIEAKLRTATAAGLTPLYCVGESTRAADPADAARDCLADLEAALPAMGDVAPVIAYEPIWAIGAPEPAEPAYVRAVCAALRERARLAHPDARVIYGGAAGPGTYSHLADSVDGVFLGRFAHDPDALGHVVTEVAASAPAEHACVPQGGPIA